jgi:hypothetical protein
MDRRMTTEKFIKRAVAMHGNRYDYSESKYETAKQKVIIRCLKHGIFEQLAHGHMSGKGWNLLDTL